MGSFVTLCLCGCDEKNTSMRFSRALKDAPTVHLLGGWADLVSRIWHLESGRVGAYKAPLTRKPKTQIEFASGLSAGFLMYWRSGVTAIALEICQR